MRISSRAIIIEDGKLVTIFRRVVKNGKVSEYYVLPGGGIEEGETPEIAVLRELKEELCVDAEIIGKVGENITEERTEHIFVCKIIGGKIELGGPEKARLSEDNFYEPTQLDLKYLETTEISYKDFIKNVVKGKYKKIKQPK